MKEKWSKKTLSVEADTKLNGANHNARDLFSSHFLTVPEFERLLAWARLNVSLIQKSPALIDKYRHQLQGQGESGKRLAELPNWRRSPEFTKREKAALSLSEIIVFHERNELSGQSQRDARRHLNVDEIIRLSQTVKALNGEIEQSAASVGADAHPAEAPLAP